LKEIPTKVPERSAGDALHATAKAGLSLLPVVGGPAVELFNSVVQPPIEKRRDEWMKSVGERLRELEETGIELEDLRSNEAFISAVMHTSTLAIRTHKEEKLAALRNALINVAIGQAPDEAIQNVFFGFVDDLTELHLRILKVFQSPPSVPGLSMGGLDNVLEHAIPSLYGKATLYKQFWKDLHVRGLVGTENLNTMQSGSGLTAKRTTDFADQFLKFIS